MERQTNEIKVCMSLQQIKEPEPHWAKVSWPRETQLFLAPTQCASPRLLFWLTMIPGNKDLTPLLQQHKNRAPYLNISGRCSGKMGDKSQKVLSMLWQWHNSPDPSCNKCTSALTHTNTISKSLDPCESCEQRTEKLSVCLRLTLLQILIKQGPDNE